MIRTRVRRRTMAIAAEVLYSQGDRVRPEKVASLLRALESGLALGGRAAGIVQLFTVPVKVPRKRRT